VGVKFEIVEGHVKDAKVSRERGGVVVAEKKAKSARFGTSR
jgi:hypothetical protein